jgi:nitrate/nitrite transporter NarK
MAGRVWPTLGRGTCPDGRDLLRLCQGRPRRWSERRKSGAKAPGFAQQFAPLKNLQVWRFSLYYFFVFGAFVALALWLPHYLIDVYGVDVRTAGMAAASFSLSASLFRAYGGHLSDKFGARSVMYWTFGFSMLFLFMLSYPPRITSSRARTARSPFRPAWACGPSSPPCSRLASS